MSEGLWVALAGLALAGSNGANDNMKGVATLLGSRTCGPRAALAWGTAATFAGSAAAILLSSGLLAAFSGKGIVPEALVAERDFLFAVGAGAALVVMVATLLRMPISTTHALVGALAGAGAAAAGPVLLGWGTLASTFFLPLLASPVVAALLVALVYPLLRRARRERGIDAETCLCAGVEPEPAPAALAPACAAVATAPASLGVAPARVTLRAGGSAECAVHYRGAALGVRLRVLVDLLHYLSAGAVSFARGLNDTPKIAAILLAGGGITSRSAMLAVGAGMAIGALLQALRVGRTMSDRITPMNPGQALTANLATAGLVLAASRLGLPVSTTHVSVGALFGLGCATRELNVATLYRIVLSWLATLPAAFVVGALVHLLTAALR